MPTVENAAIWFNAKTVTHHLDVVDTCTADGSTARFYNACGSEFMTLKSDDVSTRFDSLFGEKLVGARHAEDGRLYAILKDDDCTREETVGLFPFADVQVGPTCKFGRRITAVNVGVRPGLTPRMKPTTCFKHDTTRNPVLGSAERKEKRA